MTQRQINHMDDYQTEQALLAAARKLDRKLNLFGAESEPINGLLDPAASIDTVESRLDKIMQPECQHRRGSCSHAFPAWFCREAQPAANEFLRLLKQVKKARN